MASQADYLRYAAQRRAARERRKRVRRLFDIVAVIVGLLIVLAIPPAHTRNRQEDAGATLVQASEISIHEPWEDAGEAPSGTESGIVAGMPADQARPASSEPKSPSPPAYRPDPATYVIPILMYHDVGSPAAGLTVTPEMLEEQMAALENAGYRPVSMDAVLLAMRGEDVSLPEMPVAITFDDAYVGVFTRAYPILKKHGFTATLYVITGMVQKPGYVDWDQVRALEADGWTMGSHTVRHLDLRSLKPETLANELKLARDVLRENTAQPILSFCYPSGKYDDEVVEAVKSAGYHGAVTTVSGKARLTDDPFTLKRLRIDGREGIGPFKAKLSIP